MAEIQVCLAPVVGHEHLAVLIRTHCTRIHIDIGIQFLGGDLESAALQKPSERRRRYSFPEP